MAKRCPECYNGFMNSEFLELHEEGGKFFILCKNAWTLYTAGRIEKELRTLPLPSTAQCRIDFSRVREFDSAGILLLRRMQERLESAAVSCTLEGMSSKQRKIFQLIDQKAMQEPLPRRHRGLLYAIGEQTIEEFKLFRDFFGFLGELSISFARLLVHPRNFRLPETVYHIQQSGFNALFIIALTSILVGLVIAYQTLVQLSQFGADIFVVDAIGISITRELGPMITAIVIAGRSASSYTAEIGTMKITEEIAAMRTMGFDPFYFLVVPRIVALVIALPLLIFFADVMGILGGMIATKAQAGISYAFFIERLQEVLAAKHYILGIVKGPFFALIIAATGCFHGFRVTGDTESIGIETTASVVHAIFFVIACDALFSILYTQMGW